MLRVRPDASEVGGDLIAGGKPYPGMASDVIQRLVQVPGAERLAADEGVQGQRHDPAAASGVGVELVELVLDGLQELEAGEAAHGEQAEVVQFH